MGKRSTSTGAGGRLFVVGTPIGNLGDMTTRARDTLASVPLVAAEDTRITRRLVRDVRPAPRLVSFHARNAARRTPELVAHLRGGADLAVVTDAGTPGVSDPGGDLVIAWAAEGGVVVPVPGPSAVTAAISATAIAGPRWSFEGFLPRKGRERRQRIAAVAGDPRGIVLFEAPDRLVATLDDLASACGGDRPAAVCRELTKRHEEIVVGSLDDLRTRLTEGTLAPRGEIVIVLGAIRTVTGPTDERRGDELEAARGEVDRLVAAGLARGEAARRISRSTGLSRRRLYRV